MFQKLRLIYSMILQILRTGEPPPPFPVRERAILECGSIFNPGATFSNYVGYVRKTRFFLQEALSWDTDAVTNMVAALKLRGIEKYRCSGFIRSDVVLRIIAHDSSDIPFAQLAYISFLYALSVPSEALLLRMAFRNDDMTNFAPM